MIFDRDELGACQCGAEVVILDFKEAVNRSKRRASKMEGRKAAHWIGVSEIPSAAFMTRCAIASEWCCSR